MNRNQSGPICVEPIYNTRRRTEFVISVAIGYVRCKKQK